MSGLPVNLHVFIAFTSVEVGIVERFTEGTELIGAAEVQLQSDLIR